MASKETIEILTFIEMRVLNLHRDIDLMEQVSYKDVHDLEKVQKDIHRKA